MEKQVNETQNNTSTQNYSESEQFISKHKTLLLTIGCIVGFFILVFSVLIFSECSDESVEDNIIGYTYSGGAVSNQIVTNAILVFTEDYTYSMHTFFPYDNEEYYIFGTYQIDENNITLFTKSGSNPVYIYNESDKSLTNGNITLYQQAK